MRSGLVWFANEGLGYLDPGKGHKYGKVYLEEFRKRGQTPTGEALNKARVELVDCFDQGMILDYGCGAGDFVIKRGGHRTLGYDVIPEAVEWLQGKGIYQDPLHFNGSICFWDSLEHLRNPEFVVMGAKKYVFITMPIYEGMEEVKSSKHYKPGEHLWYFTRWGLKRWMQGLGFREEFRNTMEIALGREGVETFVFSRV